MSFIPNLHFENVEYFTAFKGKCQVTVYFNSIYAAFLFAVDLNGFVLKP
jgi:hypothetical protein